MDEPSVLDYLKSKLAPWKHPPIHLPAANGTVAEQPAIDEKQAVPKIREELQPERRSFPWPWRAIGGLLLALAAQRAFMPPDRSPTLGIALLFLAAILTAWAYLSDEWQVAPPPARQLRFDPLTLRSSDFLLGIGLAALAFLAASNNLFTPLNLLLLFSSLVFLIRAFWLADPNTPAWHIRLSRFLARPEWKLSISRWSIVVLAAVALVVFFRFYNLGQVPPEMVSDHAEKYLDVNDVLNGRTQIFFPRNGGREALQFYLLAAMHRYFGAGLDHMTLKISTALIGLLSLPFVYLLGKEMGNRRVGLLAFTFAGIAYWTNVVSRAGMRLPFYFLFTAATLYFLIRGMRTSNRNDFILAGLSLGLGFYGYSADRVLPLVVILAIGLYFIHRQSIGQRQQVLGWTLVLVLISFVVFLPLLRYITQDPTGFGYRMFSRMGTMEQPLPGPAIEIFLDNLWRALIMFSWSGGVVWGVSIPDYPVLGVVSGALFYLGAVLVFLCYLRRRYWLDLFLLVSIPVLMLPSIMALAFPSENPNLYRTGGAMVPVFLMVGIALDGLMNSLQSRLGFAWGPKAAWGLAILLLAWAAQQDYDLVFRKYYQQYANSAQNTSEMGRVIRDFSNTIGSPDSVWVMGYPHWADTRLVAINAGNPQRDYAMFVEILVSTLSDPEAKLFLIHPQDQPAIDALSRLYPQGWLREHHAKIENRDFLVYFVPPRE